MQLSQITQSVKNNATAALNQANQAIGWMKQHKVQTIAGAVGAAAAVGLVACVASGVAWPILAGLGAVALTGWAFNAVPVVKSVYQEESKKQAQTDRKQAGETLIEMMTPGLHARSQELAEAAQAKADAADRQIGARQAAKERRFDIMRKIALCAMSLMSAGALAYGISQHVPTNTLNTLNTFTNSTAS